jgi:hypothetical protein
MSAMMKNTEEMAGWVKELTGRDCLTLDLAWKPKVANVTLREAWVRYKIALERKERSPSTIAGYQDHVERLMADWLDLPLMTLGENPRMVSDRHDKLTKERRGMPMASAISPGRRPLRRRSDFSAWPRASLREGTSCAGSPISPPLQLQLVIGSTRSRCGTSRDGVSVHGNLRDRRVATAFPQYPSRAPQAGCGNLRGRPTWPRRSSSEPRALPAVIRGVRLERWDTNSHFHTYQ